MDPTINDTRFRATTAATTTTSANYALNGKIMMSSVIILFFVVSAVICLHTYSRCRRRRRGPMSHLDYQLSPSQLYLLTGVPRRDPDEQNYYRPFGTKGVDPSFVASLPTVLFSRETGIGTETETTLLECVVCLSEFDDGEKLRSLPRCGHSFHAACVDAWLGSHTNCPLCRSPVAAGTSPAESEDEMEDSDDDAAVVAPVVISEDVSGGVSEPWREESGSSEPTVNLPGLALRDDQLDLPERNRVRVKSSLKRISSI